MTALSAIAAPGFFPFDGDDILQAFKREWRVLTSSAGFAMQKLGKALDQSATVIRKEVTTIVHEDFVRPAAQLPMRYRIWGVKAELQQRACKEAVAAFANAVTKFAQNMVHPAPASTPNPPTAPTQSQEMRQIISATRAALTGQATGLDTIEPRPVRHVPSEMADIISAMRSGLALRAA